MDKREVLKRSDLFRELNDEQLDSLEKICTCEVYEQGAFICRQNTFSDKLYVIEEGLVAIILEPGPLSQRQLQAVSNFETFGWETVIPPHLRTDSAKAIEQTRVLALNGQDLIDLFKTDCPTGCVVYQGVARVVASRLQSAFMQLLGVCSQE